ncbi:hypothetical protein EIP86_005161 [Pleurotus ostreatoroseus]|nr:hypothetical protein EIP86_005161 [Pleurotus ostreatoroseus]
MDEWWGPADKTRGALAFVHIPPYTIQAVWETLNSTINPGLDADALGGGSTQGTTVAGNIGSDDPFWDALNANVKNLHAVISGHDHGDEWCAREPTKDVIFCFAKHSGFVEFRFYERAPPTDVNCVVMAAIVTPDGAMGLVSVVTATARSQPRTRPFIHTGPSDLKYVASSQDPGGFPTYEAPWHGGAVTRLSNGAYHILDSSGTMYVGRSLTEDPSVSPKPVISVAPVEAGARPKWFVQKCSGGRYTLRIANAPVGDVSGSLFAFLHPLHTPEEWVITHVQGDLYT